MHIRCPHCKNPIELADLASVGEITCGGCGSSFRLEDVSTTAWDEFTGKRIGKFEVLGTVGHGAFGTVLKARDPELDRTVALKIPRPGNVGEGPQDRERFLREARSVAQLRFPSIIAIHEVGTFDLPSPLGGEGPGVRGLPYLVSDFVEGVTLADQLSARRLTFAESAKLVAAVADALDYAHSLGVIHRDVKPSNIMIRPDGSPCLMDFGLAKRDAGEITMTIDGQVLGTPAYMSPEQARGEGHKVDARGDVYSLGVILYQLLTGELPFRGNKAMLLHQVLHDEPKPPRRLNDRIPRDLETITLKAMAKEPAGRYPSAKEMTDDLRRWLAGQPILARPVGRLEKTLRWGRRNPIVASLASILVVVVFGGSIAVTCLWLDAEQQRELAVANATTAEKERDQAEANLKEADRQRKLYEESFRQARAAVDDFIRTSEGELFNKPGLERARSKMFEIALKYHQEFIRQRGGDPALQRDLAHCYEHLGNLLGRTEGQESLAFHEKALEIREQLSLARPQDIDLQADRASSYHNIGNHKDKSGNQEQALNYYNKAVEILDRLVQDHPGRSKFQINLAKAYNNIGNVHHKSKRAAEAVVYYQKSIKLQESLTGSDPDDIEFKPGLAESYNNLGILQGETNKFLDAYRSFAKTEKCYEELAKAHPDNYVFHNGRAMAFRGMGMALAKQERREEAVVAFQQAIRHQRVALGLAPAKGRDAAQYRTFLVSHCRLLAGVLRQVGRPADAVTVLLDSRKLSVGQPVELFQVAESLALCVPLVGKDKHNLTDDEKKQRKMYLDLAMETLQLAVGAGYKEVKNLKSNPAFELLRSRPEFQKVLAELEK